MMGRPREAPTLCPSREGARNEKMSARQRWQLSRVLDGKDPAILSREADKSARHSGCPATGMCPTSVENVDRPFNGRELTHGAEYCPTDHIVIEERA